MSKTARLKDILHGSLPGAVARKLPPPELLKAWPQAAGEVIASRARPVCINEGGVLVISVASSSWRQELTMSAPALLGRLAELGFEFSQLKLVPARTSLVPPPQPPLPDLETGDEEQVQAQVAHVNDPGLRESLARVMRAQMRARKASHK